MTILFLYFYCYLGFISQAKQIIFCFHEIYLKLKCNCYHIFSGHKGAFNIHFLGGGGREGGLRDLGGTTSFFRGVVVRISCVQLSAKWELQKIDCQLTTNAYGGRGGESWELQNLMGGSGKFYCDTIQNPLTFLPPSPPPLPINKQQWFLGIIFPGGFCICFNSNMIFI